MKRGNEMSWKKDPKTRRDLGLASTTDRNLYLTVPLTPARRYQIKHTFDFYVKDVNISKNKKHRSQAKIEPLRRWGNKQKRQEGLRCID